MSKRTMAILAGLISGCAIFLARYASADGLKLSPSTPRAMGRATLSPAAGAVGELKVTIKEWDVPTKGAHPHDPALAPDGSLWFTEQLQNKLGRLDPASGAFKEYPLTVEESGPHGLVADSNGNIWFTGNGKGYIGKLDPKTGKVTEYQMPDEKAEDPHTAVFDAHGILWFTVQVGNMVGRLDPRTGKVELKAVQGQRALPYGIAINSKGVPFFCEFGTNKIAKIDPQTMTITDFTLPEAARPRRMAIDAHGIAITPDGAVWYSESGVKPNTMVRFDPKTEQFARAPIPSGGGTVRNMVATPDGRVYIACSGVNKVGVVQPSR